MDYEEILTGEETMTYEEIMHRVAHEIANCDFLFKCPQAWDKMDKTKNDEVRFCGECQKEVHFVKNTQALKELREAGKCVALWQEVKQNDADNQQTNSEKVNYDPPPHYAITAGVMVNTSKAGNSLVAEKNNENQIPDLRREIVSILEKDPEENRKYLFLKLLLTIIAVIIGLILLGVIIIFLSIRF